MLMIASANRSHGKRLLPCFLILILIFANDQLFAQNIDHWELVVDANDEWHYYLGSKPPLENWNTASFKSDEWYSGKGGFGYGDGDDSTIVSKTNSIYIRTEFNIIDRATITKACLHIDYDDAFVAYLNGVEIARSNIEGNPPAHNLLASALHEAVMYKGKAPECFIVSNEILNSQLHKGNNVLAIQVHNKTSGSSDLSAIPFFSVAINNSSINYRSLPDWFFVPFFGLESSNLPIITINTENQVSINKDAKIKAHMKIIDQDKRNNVTDSANAYNGNIGIKIRGHYSSGLPQKPYSIETRNEFGENLNVELLDMPKENDWILLANYNDKTFMRNSLSYELFRQMGHYASRTRLCEVIINDEYKGIYVFAEKIKQDKARVDIAKLKTSDTYGDKITGGYIWKVDYKENGNIWYSKPNSLELNRDVFFVFHDPEKEDMPAVQSSYIENYIDHFESVLFGNNFKDSVNGYRAYINSSSFIDYFIMAEISRNVDGYKKSKYYFKEKNSDGGLIHSGPAWDYDWSFKNFSYDFSGAGWIYPKRNTNPKTDGWINRMMEDRWFTHQLHQRYYALRKTILSNEWIINYTDSVHTLVNEAQVRHYQKWDILGKHVGANEKDDEPDTYDGVVTKFENWLITRLNWLDENMHIFYSPTYKNDFSENRDWTMKVFPNPASNYLFIDHKEPIKRIILYDITGKKVLQINTKPVNVIKLDIHTIQKQLYFIQVETINGKIEHSKFIKR